MIVCSCHAVSDHTLREAARSGQSPEQILAATGAGSDCGHCRDALEAILGTSDGPCRSQPCAGCPRRAPTA